MVFSTEPKFAVFLSQERPSLLWVKGCDLCADITTKPGTLRSPFSTSATHLGLPSKPFQPGNCLLTSSLIAANSRLKNLPAESKCEVQRSRCRTAAVFFFSFFFFHCYPVEEGYSLGQEALRLFYCFIMVKCIYRNTPGHTFMCTLFLVSSHVQQ